jgi:hypothetical protein
MGQAITVTRVRGVHPEVVRFELNRSLTGMGIERYHRDEPVNSSRPPDELARKLFALGATAVTVYSNVVTVQAPPDVWSRIGDDVETAITNLFIYYRDGAAPAPEHAEVEAADAPAPT